MKHLGITLIILAVAALVLSACVPVTARPAQPQGAVVDPLLSWNPGPTKDAILSFVADVTDAAGLS